MFLLSSCSLLLLDEITSYTGRFNRTDKVLVLVDDAVFPVLEDALVEYASDLAVEKVDVTVEQWTAGTAADLRSLLAARHHDQGIDGAFLVGDLPAAWYAMTSEFRYEEFPCDLYLMDPDSVWTDANHDGRLDAHSPLRLSLYVSRLRGTAGELAAYFRKLHDYRTGASRLPPRAYIFKDDDWFAFRPGSNFGLGLLYGATDIDETVGRTVKPHYLDTLTADGYEFVYQWIHSYPSALCVKEAGLFKTITVWDVAAFNLKGHFYNLYDCSAARFTERNLGMTYLAKTDSALAVFGSTKVGGCYYPLVFYQVLAQGGTWGDAYLNWYNYYGRRNDSWNLGMVILGDPTLTPTSAGPAYRFIDLSLPAEPDGEAIRRLEETGYDFQSDRDLTGFDAYREAHPEFFPP